MQTDHRDDVQRNPSCNLTKVGKGQPGRKLAFTMVHLARINASNNNPKDCKGRA